LTESVLVPELPPPSYTRGTFIEVVEDVILTVDELLKFAPVILIVYVPGP
jgi:hypothetical protein